MHSGKRTALCVPSGSVPLNSFEPILWTATEPKCFVYGDGVWGIRRKTALTFREWSSYLLERDELEYDVEPDIAAVAASYLRRGPVEVSVEVSAASEDASALPSAPSTRAPGGFFLWRCFSGLSISGAAALASVPGSADYAVLS